MNFRWRDAFSPAELELLNEAMGETLAEFGYDLDFGSIPRGGPCVRRPFPALSHAQPRGPREQCRSLHFAG